MPSKFSKALLAAALVGCGGGSSTTTMSGVEPTEPTAAETAAEKVRISYTSAKSLVDALSPDSGDVQKDAAESAVNDLRRLVSTTVDLSAADRTTFDNNINTLLASIKTNTTPEPTPPPVQPTPPDPRNDSWLKAVRGYELDSLGTWPGDNKLAGTPTNPDLRDGWTVMNYDYPRNTTDEQGKTFKKNVVKPTPEIKLRWDEVVEAAKTNRGTIINNYLGGSGLMIEIFEGGVPAAGGGGAATTTVTNTTDLRRVITTIPTTVSLAGTGIVYQQSTGKAIGEAAGEGVTAFTENSGNNVITTSFHREDFTKMDANDLVNLPTSPTAGWDIDASFVNFGAGAQYVMWKGITGIMTYVDDSSGTSEVRVRFNPTTGFLEYVPAGGILAAAERTMMSFVPITTGPLLDATQEYANLDTSIHSKPLTLREGEIKTSVMEFAYWSSQNKSSPFAVSVDTFARQYPDMMFDDVTTNPGALTGGSITYNGLAAGYYAMGTESNGEFTADAMLTANFGTNMIDGTINNFMPMAGEDDLSPWSLTLISATFMDDNTFGNTFTGNTRGGGNLGNWSGQFLGKANPGTDLESAMDMTNDYPEAVVGNFQGHLGDDNYVMGAFGAELHANHKE